MPSSSSFIASSLRGPWVSLSRCIALPFVYSARVLSLPLRSADYAAVALQPARAGQGEAADEVGEHPADHQPQDRREALVQQRGDLGVARGEQAGEAQR